MKKNGFTLVELLGVIAVMGVLIVIVATNGFGIFNKVKSNIDKLEEDNLLEAARVFLVDVDNDLISEWPTTCSNKSVFSVVCDDSGNCSTVTITDGNINTTSCTNCGCNVDVGYLEEKLYFNDGKNKCDDDAILNLKLLGELEYIDYIVAKVNTDAICTKTDGTDGNIDYKLIKAAKDYLKELDESESSNYYGEKELTVEDFIDESGFEADSGYSCNLNSKLKLQIKGRFVATDFIAEKQSEDQVICSN